MTAPCEHCNGDGGWIYNPDWPMGDCGDRGWEECPHCDSPSRRAELFFESSRRYQHARYGTPLPPGMKVK